MSKLSDFLKTHKIDSRRILVTSKQLEALRTEDRTLKLTKRAAKAGDESKKEAAAAKPRSGRPVPPATLATAIAGESISGPTKTRILRAVNALLEKKKKPAVGLRDLF